MSALLREEILHDAADYGLTVTGDVAFDWSGMLKKRNAYIERLNGIYQRNLDNSKVEIIRGAARFVGEKRVEVGGSVYTADHILIAVGGRPLLPNIPGADLGITSDGFFELESRPGSVVVVGAGYIAVEMAQIFAGLGSDTTLCIRGDSVLRNFDQLVLGRSFKVGTLCLVELLQVSQTVTEEVEHSGVKIKRRVQVAGVAPRPGGGVQVSLDSGDTVAGDTLLWAVGRTPATDTLGCRDIGLELDGAGHVVVDTWQDTNVAGVHALGDVAGKALLTPVAIAAGRRLAHRLFDNKAGLALDYDNIPSVVFSHPPVNTTFMFPPCITLTRLQPGGHYRPDREGGVCQVRRGGGDRVRDQVHAAVPRAHTAEAGHGDEAGVPRRGRGGGGAAHGGQGLRRDAAGLRGGRQDGRHQDGLRQLRGDPPHLQRGVRHHENTQTKIISHKCITSD